MKIITEVKLKEFVFDDGSKLFYTPLDRLEYQRIVYTPANIRQMGEKKEYSKKLSSKELKEFKNEESRNLMTGLVLNHAEELICDSCVIENWQGFEDEKGKKIEFSQDMLRKYIRNCDVTVLLKILMDVTDSFFIDKKKEEKKEI